MKPLMFFGWQVVSSRQEYIISIEFLHLIFISCFTKFQIWKIHQYSGTLSIRPYIRYIMNQFWTKVAHTLLVRTRNNQGNYKGAPYNSQNIFNMKYRASLLKIDIYDFNSKWFATWSDIYMEVFNVSIGQHFWSYKNRNSAIQPQRSCQEFWDPRFDFPWAIVSRIQLWYSLTRV